MSWSRLSCLKREQVIWVWLNDQGGLLGGGKRWGCFVLFCFLFCCCCCCCCCFFFLWKTCLSISLDWRIGNVCWFYGLEVVLCILIMLFHFYMPNIFLLKRVCLFSKALMPITYNGGFKSKQGQQLLTGPPLKYHFYRGLSRFGPPNKLGPT